jgi:hypothetical protein
MASGDWIQCVSRLQEGLKKENCDIRLDVKDFQSFQSALDDLCTQYSRKDTSRLIRDKIRPHLLHVQSFEKAISACTQNDQTVSLIWGASQAVIEVRNL